MDENSADLATPNTVNLDLGAFDSQTSDILSIEIVPPDHGVTSLGTKSRSVPPTNSDCNIETETTGALPCDLVLPNNKVCREIDKMLKPLARLYFHKTQRWFVCVVNQ